MSMRVGKKKQSATLTQSHSSGRRPNHGKRDLRFRQLRHKADNGDETAVHDLWAEFQFNYHGEDSTHE